MNLFYYKEINARRVVDKIKESEYLSLSPYQLGKITEILEDFHVFEFDGVPSRKTSVYVRLTAPLYLLCWLLLILFMPVKWVFTGDRYKYDGKIVSGMSKWKDALKL